MTFGWAFTFLFCFKLFHGAWGDCPSPPNIPNTSPVAETFGATGQEIVYTCDRSTGYYEIPGKSTTITCQAEGTWTVIEEFCTSRLCGNPGEIENGKMEADEFLFGSRVTYTCNTGYRMISRRNYRDCQADGTWSNAPPQCEVAICEAPNVQDDITIDPQKDEYNYLDSVTFSCKKPLEIAGNASIHCTADGTWSSDFPTCKVSAVNCPDPDVPNSIRVSGFVAPHGLHSAITFKCKEDFVLKGSSTIKCNIDSQWEPRIPECKPSKCDKMWELQEEARKCTSTPDEWIKYLQVQYLYLQIENLKLDIEIKKKKLSAKSTT